jgi:hypothetical protein
MFVVQQSLDGKDVQMIVEKSVGSLINSWGGKGPMGWKAGSIGFYNFASRGFEGVIYVGKDLETIERYFVENYPEARVPTKNGLSVLAGTYSGKWSGRRIQRKVMSPFPHAMGFISSRRSGNTMMESIIEGKHFGTFYNRYRLQDSGAYLIFTDRLAITSRLVDVAYTDAIVPIRRVLEDIF